MRFHLLALAVLGLIAAPAAAQLTLDWVPRDDLDLPPSIQVFESDGSPIEAWYVRAELADASWTVRAERSDEGLETVASFAEDASALVAVNGGYYGGSQSFSLIVRDGQTLASNIGALNRDGVTYYPTRGAFGVSEDRTPDVAWIYDVSGTQYAYPAPSPNQDGDPQPQPTADFPAGGAPWSVVNAIGGGPVLVEDGEVVLTWEEEVFFGGSGVDTTSTRARTVAGYTDDGALLLLAVQESPGVTLRQAGELMLSLGAVEAVNLDGGGSTNLVAGGEPLYTTTRQVASALLIVPTTDTGEVIYDTGFDCCYFETGDWFESANTPFYGTTPSRLNEVGDGSDRAVFILEGLDDAGFLPYRIDAWWVPAPNRAVDTPFTIYSGGSAEKTIRVDQTDPATAGQWNALGAFILAPGDSIVVTDDATGAGAPAYISVDALRLTPLGIGATETGPGRSLPLSLYPNPTWQHAHVAFALDTPGRVRVEVLDLLGRRVYADTTPLGAGPHRLPLDLAGQPVGVYIVRLQTPDGAATRKLTVLK